jgi:hypothetical protein
MPNDPFYEAVISRARVHLLHAWDEFCEDPALNWRERAGNVPKERVRVWIDALRRDIEHYEMVERALG